MKFLPTKDEFALKLINYPMLNSVLCLLIYERMFRLAFFAALLFIPLVLLSILKVWRTTPAGFIPEVKVSGIDFVQAWSLRRTAEKEAAQGRFEDALYSWRIAAANNPGNPDLIRGCLRHLGSRDDARKYAQTALGYSSWLLRLTSTNAADLELAVKVFQTYRLDDATVYILTPIEDQLTSTAQSAYLKAIFNRGEISRFASRWNKRKQELESDPELRLYHAAYLSGWGPHETAPDGKQLLDKAKEDPALRDLAHRLQLRVSERLLQMDTYRESLAYLQERRLDTLTDHVGHWQLQAMLGGKTEAVRLLQNHVQPPTSGEEAVTLAKAYFDFGFPDTARDLMKRYSTEFVESEAIWLSYSNLLIDQKRWDDLFEVALQLRHEAHPLRDRLHGYSYYIEGVAQARRDRRDDARAAFKKLLEAHIRNKLWELSAAETAENLGFADIAQELLLDIQKDVPNTPEYWMLLAKTAYETKEPSVLVTAMSSAYKLRPDDFTVVNNFAASLLSTRQRPEQALQLTARVLQKSPGLAAARINHACALVQNQKNDEAKTLLATVEPASLKGSDLTSYHMAEFELNLNLRQFVEAKRHSEKIELQHLFSTERQWLEKAKKELPASPPEPKKG
ncbi:MAG: hypothetical protein EXS31_13615 [Pedosphaera sp.]|nr:hypothetical protein [Pedosphaera sp.]